MGAEALFAQLPSLRSSPVFFLFTAEAWEESGSRRFLTDVNKFSCRDDAAASADTCDEPYKPDLTFAQLAIEEGGNGLFTKAFCHGLRKCRPEGSPFCTAAELLLAQDGVDEREHGRVGDHLVRRG